MSAKTLAAALRRIRAEAALTGVTPADRRRHVALLISCGARQQHAIELIESMVASLAVAALARPYPTAATSRDDHAQRRVRG